MKCITKPVRMNEESEKQSVTGKQRIEMLTPTLLRIVKKMWK